MAPGGLDQGYTVTSGFAFDCLHFLPGNQSSSTFRYLGTEAVGARNYYVVAFAERPQGKTTTFVDVGGLEIPTVVQGIAWIDQESFQISRMRTDLVESSTLSDAAGFAQPQGTCSADDGGHIRGNSTSGCCDPLWLPSEVTVQGVFNGDGFHNEHRYTNYERFRVSSKIVTH